MKVLVTGGSGYLGRNFIKHLLIHEPDVQIVALSRSEKADANIRAAAEGNPSAVTIARGDLMSSDALVNALAGVEVVFHSAAKADPWGKWEEFVEANVDGTQNLLRASKTAGVRRFVHVSSEAVLLTGLNNGCLTDVDETAPLALDPPFYAPYTKSKAMAEKAVLEFNGDGIETIVVRPRFIWGRDDTTIGPELAANIRNGIMRFASPPIAFSVCHVDNCCEGMLLAARGGRPGQAYFLTDGAPIDQREFVAGLTGMPCDKIGSISPSLFWGAAVLVENIPFAGFNVTRKPPVSRQILGLFFQSVRVKDDKARAELGYVGRVTWQEGLKTLAR